MAEPSNIARPYAQAVFELAQESDSFDQWSNYLQLLSDIVGDENMQMLIANPGVTRNQLLDLILEIAGEQLDEHARNLVRVLNHYRRLNSAPLILKQYEALRAKAEGVIEADMETAFPISDEQSAMLADALQKTFGRKIRMKSTVNKELIGGVIIRAGDWVVDGSVRARLSKLARALDV